MSELTYLVEEMKNAPDDDSPFQNDQNFDLDYGGLSGGGNKFGFGKGKGTIGMDEDDNKGNAPATLDELKDLLGAFFFLYFIFV